MFVYIFKKLNMVFYVMFLLWIKIIKDIKCVIRLINFKKYFGFFLKRLVENEINLNLLFIMFKF